MTLRSIWRVIARWKWIVIPGLVVALCAGAALFLRTPKTYTVEASYLFLSPVKDTKGVASNPFLQLGGGVDQAVDVLSVSLVDGQTVRSFTKHEPQLQYTAARDQTVAAPLMLISVQDVDRKAAASTLASLGTILGTRLNAMQQQAGAPPGQWITMTKLTDDPKPKIGYSDGIRNGVLGFAAVLLLAFIAVAVAERIRVHRAAARERAEAEGDVTRHRRRRARRTPQSEPVEDGPYAADDPSGTPPGPDPEPERVPERAADPERATEPVVSGLTDRDADELEELPDADAMSRLRG